VSVGARPARRPRGDEPLSYAPARRLYEVRALLETSGGASVYDIAERFGVSVRTALRYLEALRAAEEPLYEERDGKRKVWRLLPTARKASITLSTSQMLALFLSRRVFDFLAGTGFKEDLDDVFRRLEATLSRRDFLAARHLDRKIHDINEAPHVYEGRLDHVDDILTALIKEERLSVTHESVSRGRKSFTLDPYTLVVYRKGLYLTGRSHEHGAVRTFALDAFREVEWRRGERFVYPDDYHPARLFEGAFGIIGGAPTPVRVWFSEKVSRFVERRRWHPSQTLRRVPGGVELRMTVSGTVELTSWLLGFGAEAEVLEPAALRALVAGELGRALARYAPEPRRPGTV
jgi:predicted DNA-binding transcriptional regulator YafY